MTMLISSSMTAAAPITSRTVSNTCRLKPVWMLVAAPLSTDDTSLEAELELEEEVSWSALSTASAACWSPMALSASDNAWAAIVFIRVPLSLCTFSPPTAWAR